MIDAHAEDRAVDTAVAMQEAAGLTVLTDGEMRRLSFQSQMAQAVEGFGTSVIGNKLGVDKQAAKLCLICEVAERVWG